MEQDILIYIDDKEKLDASATANSFAHKDIKNRAYINTLGAELAMKYLVSENIDVSDAKNLHSIKKILEEMDIADVMLSNIHIDVRVVFDENVIFIPKSHFEYDILPDIYLVFNLSQDRSYVKFLGFFEPKMINKNNSNSEYYFIEKEKLNSAQDLINYINSHKSPEIGLSQDELETSERFIVSVYDNDISEDDKKQLLKQLTKSAELRDKFIEFENFETLSYKAMNDPMIEKKEVELETTETSDETSVDVAQTLDVLELDDNSLDLNDLADLDRLADVENAVADSTETPDRADISGSEFSSMASDLAKGVTEGLAQGAVQGAVGGMTQGLVQGAGAMGLAEGVAQGITGGLVDGAIDLTKDLAKGAIDATADVANGIADTISFDDIELSENSDQQVETNTEDTISLDDVELPEGNQVQTDLTSEDTISLDDIEISQPQDTTTEEPTEDLLSLNNIDNIQSENLLPEEDIDLTSLDNIEPLQAHEVSEDTNVHLDELTSDEDIVDTTGLSDIVEPDLSDITLDDIVEAKANETLNLENTEETASESSDSSFGKNLLENLSAEDEENNAQAEPLDNIDIDNLDLDESAPQLANDISSDDLLSQIDDILNTSSAGNEPIDVDASEVSDISGTTDEQANIIAENETPTENNTSSTDEMASIEDLTGLEDLNDVGYINDLPDYKNTETTEQNSQSEPSEESSNSIKDESDLSVLYNEDATGEHPELPEEEVPALVLGVALYNKKSADKKSLIVASTLIVLFAVSSAFLFMKPKNDNSADVEPLPAKNEIPVQTAKETPSDDILASNTPQAPVTTQKDIAVTKPVVKELQNTPPKTAKAEPYIEVNKIVWDVPNELSYSSKMQNYLRTAGRSIKLSLSTDLLLATEYAYTNQIKVGLKLDKSGSVRDARILSSSGSTQIDNIVLQSVKDTLNIVKPPVDEISTPEFNLNLIIYI